MVLKHRYLLLFIVLYGRLAAQTLTLSGRITSGKDPLPFATILVKGTTVGSNSNADGYYSLKLPRGKYQIVFQFVGYSRKTKEVELLSDTHLDMDLQQEGISLKEVEIRAGEDPSYPIIRQAIKKRKFYREQLNHYSCNAYIKGLQKITALPKNMGALMKIFRGIPSDTTDLKGVIYLSESVSRYYYQRPDREKEIMISSKVSGDNKSFSFNQLSDVSINFNDKLVQMGGISARPFVSPLHDNAFFFYRFFLLGKITGEGKIINKIKVVPKRMNDPCFSGIIYIQDSTWRITGVDMMVTRENKIQYVDTLYIKQLNAAVVNDSVWMPVTLNLSFKFSVLGFRGNGYFNANIKDYDIFSPLERKFFSNEVLRVNDGANKKDTAYWNTVRAVPLTPEEQRDYKEKDSITAVRSTDRYKDSTDRLRNKFKFSDVFFGYSYHSSKKKLSFWVPGLITYGIQYNTVEGVNLSYKMGITKHIDDVRTKSLTGRIRYGLANSLLGGEITGTWYYRPLKFEYAGFTLKSIAEQYNQQDPIAPLVNSIYSLLLNENYMKLYRETGIECFYHKEAWNGFYVTGFLRYLQRDPLRNSTDRLIIDDKSKLFTSNDPNHAFTHDSMFTSNRAFTASVLFNIRFKQKYYSLPGEKVVTGSKYPRVDIAYKKAFPFFNTTADYDLASIAVSDHIRLGLFGRFSYRLRGGGFLNFRKLYFMDFRYFLGNQTIFNTNDYLSSYRLLPYYTFSADRWFAEAHAEHHFRGFITNKIPWLKKFNIQEVAGIHFLSSNRLPYYYELNFGIEKIFKIVRIDYVLGYSNEGRMRQGVTIGFGLSF